MNNKLEINIAFLYPDIMNNCGDVGNILALENRLKWRGMNVNVTKILQNDNIDFEKHDIFYLGGAEDKYSITAPMLLENKNEFHNIANQGKVVLGICGGYQLLGNYIEDESGKKYNGLGLLDIYTVLTNKRFTGNVTVETDFLKTKNIVGFENHRGNTYLQNNTQPIGKVVIGHGNNNKDLLEGTKNMNIFGSYLHGPILPKNSEFCDYILQCAISTKPNNNNCFLEQINDNIEMIAHSKSIKMPY